MPVDTPHADYLYWSPLWQKIRDVVGGEHVVQGKGRTYIPGLAGMDADDYLSYLFNARLFPATARTIQGLLGAAFRVPPVTEVPESMREWLRDIDLAGTSLDAFLKKELEDKLKPGRYGVRVDMREGGGRTYFAPYAAETILNWREGMWNGRRVLTRVVLQEFRSVTSPEDEFVDDEIEICHVLDLVNGQCRVREFRRAQKNSDIWIPTTLEPPTKNGQLLDFIPFVFDGPVTPEKPPLLDLTSTNLGHYRLTADYYDAMLFTSKPQPWVSGMQPLKKGEANELRIGSRHAWRLPANATTGYLQSSGAGIADIRQALIDDETRMARLGAAVIEEPKAGVESAETARINQSGKASVLSGIVTTTSQAATAALRMMAWWGGMTAVWDDPRITCTLNQDFIEARLSPQDLLALIQSWQARGISRDTMTYNIQRGGLLPEGRTIEEEMALVDSEGPIMQTTEEEDLDNREDDEEETAVDRDAA